eukprot:3069024-Pyramimonas_sp.AAC.1
MCHGLSPFEDCKHIRNPAGSKTNAGANAIQPVPIERRNASRAVTQVTQEDVPTGVFHQGGCYFMSVSRSVPDRQCRHINAKAR